MRKTYSLFFMLACAFGASGAQKQTFSVLDSFQNFPHGASPYAPLYRDASGNLYGTTAYGGSKSNEYLDGSGVVFKLDANGRETVLHNFTGGLDGGNPYAGVVMDSAGNLYGTTFQGGIGQGQLGSGAGVVFKIDWSGRYSVLYRFTGGADGSGPASNLILDAAGYLYGTTAGGGPQNYGVVFKAELPIYSQSKRQFK